MLGARILLNNYATADNRSHALQSAETLNRELPGGIYRISDFR